MGVEAFLISSSLEGVLAQRLVRRICANCRVELAISEIMKEKLRSFGADRLNAKFYSGRGCEECRGTGYRGRIGVFELLAINSELRELILQRRSSAEIKSAAQKTMVTMQQDALAKAASGLTSLEEIIRVTAGDLTE
jgi:type II secretory ATPase GspE/PulE/Tfp pilus assembly ATPase PilB-like protein